MCRIIFPIEMEYNSTVQCNPVEKISNTHFKNEYVETVYSFYYLLFLLSSPSTMNRSKTTLVCFGLLCALFQISICEFTDGYLTKSENDSLVSKANTTKLVGRTANEDCNCGDASNGCENREGEIFCDCKTGYLQDTNGFCRECHCGMHGNCSFEKVSEFLRKKCDCFLGYADFGGICYACSCGIHGICEFDHKGRKMCICDHVYGSVLGTCTLCGCQPMDNCSFDAKSGRCQCMKGFGDVNGLCKDINECLNPGVCPVSSKCVNSYGSYDCLCKDGFEEPPGHFDPKEDDCQDIDECLKLDTPCLYEYTTCVNTPGSYRCDCKKGYQPLISHVDPSQPPKYNDCIEDTSSSKKIAITVGCLCGAMLIGLLVAIQYKGRRR